LTPNLHAANTLRNENGVFNKVSFFIAMRNRRATASYLYPQTIINECSEFLIVSRSGGQNEYLSISTAGACTGKEVEAPTELKPGFVIYATLVSQDLNCGEIFVVERDRPKGLEPEGRHLGGDGYVLLCQSDSDVSLKGAVRLRPGAETRPAANHCLLLGANDPGATVHLDAGYLPWYREILPNGFANRQHRPNVQSP
jgi:hypothetical protein